MAGRTFFHPLALGMAAAFEHAQVIEVFPRRNVAQRVGRTDHRRPAGIEAMDALDEGVAKAALEQHGGEGGGGHRRQLLPAFLAQRHGDSLGRADVRALPAGCQFLWPNVSACIRAPNLRSVIGRSSAMAATDKLFAGSIPEIYDRFLVPLIFESYARDLAERLARLEPRDVLETAAGTGVLTRAMASRLPAQARIVATDLNPPMLNHAQSQSRDGRITWRQADALALPFQDQSFDAVACQFGAMFLPDKVQGYREARRVLKRGGHFLFNVWDRISENQFADVVT